MIDFNSIKSFKLNFLVQALVLQLEYQNWSHISSDWLSLDLYNRLKQDLIVEGMIQDQIKSLLSAYLDANVMVYRHSLDLSESLAILVLKSKD